MKKWIDGAFLALVVLALVLGGGYTLWSQLSGGADAILYYDNRAPAPAPGWSRSGLWTGEDFTQLDSYLSDRFPHRDDLIALDTQLDLALGRPVVHGVAVGEDALLSFHEFYHWDVGYLAQSAQAMAQKLSAVQTAAQAYGGRLFYLGVPHQYSYFAQKYPSYMNDRQWLLSETRAQFSAALAEQGIPFVDMVEVYDDLGRPDEFYSASDHHYTYQGMLAAYQALLERVNAETGLDLRILTGDELALETLPNPFLGSQNRKLYGRWPTQERLTVAQLKDPIPFTRTDNGQAAAPSLYALPEDDSQVSTYSVYMGGDVAETVIETNRPELPKCLIWGDSFTNPLETLLWASFDETRSLDLRYDTQSSLTDYIAQYQPDVIICLRDDTAWLDITGNGDIR